MFTKKQELYSLFCTQGDYETAALYYRASVKELKNPKDFVLPFYGEYFMLVPCFSLNSWLHLILCYLICGNVIVSCFNQFDLFPNYTIPIHFMIARATKSRIFMTLSSDLLIYSIMSSLFYLPLKVFTVF